MWKMPNKRHSNFLELLYKKKEKFPIDCFFDELDVGSYFFNNWTNNFLDVFFVQNRVIRPSKDLFRKTYSTKKFSFEPRIEYHSFKLTAELHLTRKEMLFILEKLKLIKKSYDNLSKTLLSYSQICQNSPAKFFLFHHFFKDFQSSKACMIRFGIRCPEICSEKIINFKLSTWWTWLSTWLSTMNLIIYSKINNFSLILYRKHKWPHKKNFFWCYFWYNFFLCY